MRYRFFDREKVANNVLFPLMRDENSVTRLLVAICRAPNTRRVILKLFFNIEFPDSLVESLDIIEQVHLECGRPDIEFFGDNFYALAEVKTSVSTPLQSSQPEKYLQHIANKYSHVDRKYFLIIVPPDYCLKEFNSRLEEFEKNNKGHKIVIRRIFWDEFISALKTSEVFNQNFYVYDFYHAARNYFGFPEISFTDEQLKESDLFTKEAANALRNIFRLTHQLSAIFLQNNYDVNLVDKKNWWDGEDYGFYISLDNYADCYIYIGLWMKFWTEHGSPFVISIDSDVNEQTALDFKKILPSAVRFKSENQNEFFVSTLEDKYLKNDSAESITNLIMPFIVKYGRKKKCT